MAYASVKTLNIATHGWRCDVDAKNGKSDGSALI